ncbi:breast cancer type 2 susceptibility protein isoform X2 [Plectropomus leopardus]|uniref:breast cancer type 2 susceptibility protein isoform X2 n=1 Tax=Plectropomus leopardus TaxID=160734 RepID=UPI001C4D5B14|nr:breast cancer type 2 susceptibility protein isoform X2 [Plectropomus leopardus]
MDLPSKTMYDTFKDEIWKELGPLDPNWFEALTAQTFTNEESISDQDDLCANQEGHFKTPAVDSQLFSTPKVFRRSRVVSPETEDEQSLTFEQEKETLPLTATQSPYLFRVSKEGVPGEKYGGSQPQYQDSFDLLHTPQKSPVGHAKHISESLGAQIHPDMSWTSSLNTPPAVPSTLILSKTDESPCPVSVSADKNVEFVRKLFPSLSNASKVGTVSPKNDDMPSVHQGVVSPEASQNPEPHDSPQSSLNQSGVVWKQKLPDAIEDGEIRSAVASVLDGAENVLSLFFTKSSSALRKAKTDRSKRKQIIPTKEHTDNNAHSAESSEQRTADQEHGILPSSPPIKTGDVAITQWSPLSLSEIPPCTVDTSCHDSNCATQMENKVLTGQLQSDSDSGLSVRPLMKTPDSGFTTKKRKFVYTVVTSKLQVQGKDTRSQRMDSSPGIPDSGQGVHVKQLEKARDEADIRSIGKNEMQKQANLAEENLPPSVQAKIQDLDMSQLCKDFAQDFSQMLDPSNLSKGTEDTTRKGFSPSACLSAMKQAKQKAMQANPHRDCNGNSESRHVSTTNQKNCNEGTISDSGFQSAVADSTHVTASFVLPSSEISGQSQQWTDFKTDIHRTSSFTSTNTGNGKAHLDHIVQKAETDAKLPSAIKENQMPGLGRESESNIESTSAQLPSCAKGTVDNINCAPLNGPVHGSLPEKTTVSLPSVHTSGFKTASNKGINVSSANLKRAKRLFEETEGERTTSNKPAKCACDIKEEISVGHGSVNNQATKSNQPLSTTEKNVDISCQLTASQKADVTELCTLLEEADSQFEFTQFRTAKPKQHSQDNATSPQKVDKELDSDFLSGIDFDDSFSLEAEKQVAAPVMHDNMTLVSHVETHCGTSNITSKSTGLPLSSPVEKEYSSTKDVSSSSKHSFEGSSSIMSVEPKNLDRAGHTETSNLENKNPLMLGVGFKTAGGNVLRVSKTCLSKARALFADLQDNLVTCEKPPDKQSSKTEAETQHKRCVDNHNGTVLHHNNILKSTAYGNDKKRTVQGCLSNMKEYVCSGKQVTGIRDEGATTSLKNNIMDTTTCQSGFQLASGKDISISAKAMQEADAFFKDCDTMDTDTGMSVNKKESKAPLSRNVIHKKTLLKYLNVQGMEVQLPEKPINESENGNACQAAPLTEVVQQKEEIPNFGFKNMAALTNAAFFNGNPSSTVEVLSSLSGTTSKNIGSSAIDELRNDSCSSIASGKKVSISADTMKKAEHLLNEIHTLEGTNKKLKPKGDALRTGHLTNHNQLLPPKNCGFQKASGKGVVISSTALKKAKLLLSECDGVEDEIGVKPMHSKTQVPGPQPRNSEFLAASGKPVAFSSEALQKAKALFSDIAFSAEFPAASDTRNRDKKQGNAGNTEKMHCGFTTAGGAKLHVSQNNLLKAKDHLKEFDDDCISAKEMQESDAFFEDWDFENSIDGKAVKHEKSTPPLSGSGCEKRSSSGEPGSGCIEFDNVNVGPDIKHEEMLHPHDKEIHKGVFKNTSDSLKAASVHGNSSVMTQPFSAQLCTTSVNISSSAINESSTGGGFCTASGIKVFVSNDAITKAKSLVDKSTTFEDTNKHLKHREYTFLPQNSGFQTDGCKGVPISSAALEQAKTLLNECERAEGGVDIKPPHSKMPVPGLPPRNSGFLAASGKPVAFSSEALQKAKALFSDISFSAEIPAASDTRNSDKKQGDAENTEKMHCGFTTAGGAEVHVSQNSLLKAKKLLKEFDGDCISAKAMQETDSFFEGCDIKDDNNSKRKAPMSRTGGEKKNIYAEPGGGHWMLHPDDEEIHKAVFKNTSDSLKAASVHGNPSVMTKPLSSQLNPTSKNVSSSTINESNGGGFCTASGKKVSLSDDAMTKAKSLLNEIATFEDTNKHLKQKQSTFPAQNGGFQTASGKGVSISSAALKKAKTLLNECDGVEDGVDVNPSHPKMQVLSPLPGNSGFLAASGKPVAFSSEARQKAKALFSDIAFSAEIPAASDTRNSDKKQGDAENTEKMHCGFTTAGGAKVHVSQNNLLKAKNFWKEFDDGEYRDSNSYPGGPHKSDLSKVKITSNSNLTTASEENKFNAPRVLKPLQEMDHGNETSQNPSLPRCFSIKDKTHTNPSGVCNLNDNPGEEMSSMLDYETNQTISSEGPDAKRPQESSVLNFKSLNLSGCTDTQQRFFAQEALDCTKALLEDEGLAGQSLSMTLEDVPLQDNPKSSFRSEEEQKGTGKRSVEDPDVTGQPPLKRRLLEEFDRTIHGPRGSTLNPEKSFPNGVMKDRRVFQYSDSLKPNITRPHRNGKNSVETTLQKTTTTQHSTPGNRKSAHSKTPVFVPPFLKNAKTEHRKNTELKDTIRTPSVFVPPFKKQRTVVQEISSKPQEEEEDKHRHLSATHFNGNTFVLPTKNTQSTTDETGNKSKEDIQTVALADTPNDYLMNNQKLPVGCGSEDSAAEVSLVDNTLSASQAMFQNLQNIELARDMQDMRIRKKKRQTIRPLPGSLFLTKTSGVLRIPLKAAVNGKSPARYSKKQLYGHGVHQHVFKITSETAESFRFSLGQFIKQEAFIDGGGVQLADGGWLIPSKDGTAGKEEFYRALCDTPGVDPKLISEEWVHNHYRWIVWKQASMERSFPETMGSLCLTPEQVLLQLKYRYDVEVDHSRRPALRKIMEKDDTSAKTLVLCVCGVVSRGHSLNKQSFNDAKTPQGRVAVGGKLIIHGAQLMGSQDACSPLEAPESLMLKICANSSRPARWNTKLGFHRDPRPFLLPVSCLYSSGGPVGCVDIIILRSYPIQWMERKPDGGVVFRSVRAEEKEARRYNSHKQKAMEILFARIQAEFEKEDKGNNKPQRRRRTISRQSIASLQDGEELYEAVKDDPAYFEAHLSEQQLESLQTYRRSLIERKQAALQDRYRRALENAEDSEGSCPKRDVTPVWRLCIADSSDKPGSVYQLNLWRPPSDLQSLLKEGCRYKVYNLATSDGKKPGGTSTLQLTGTKKTQFQDLQASQEWLSTRFQSRVSTHFVDLQNTEFQPLCGEVDLAGYVISIIDGQGFSPAFYLTDGKMNFVKVRCFSSFAQSGLDDWVKPRALLALSNLQLRGQSTAPTPVVYAGDLTVFSTNPKEVHLQEIFSQLRNLVQGQENFFPIAEEKLSHLVKSDGLRSISSPALQTRASPSATIRRQDTKTRVMSQQPARSLGSFTPVSRKPSAANCSTEKDPCALKRKRALDYLSRVPSPPPLSHLVSMASPCVNKTFNPPRRSGTPSTLKTVQTPVITPVEDEWVNDEELAMIDTQALHVGDLL